MTHQSFEDYLKEVHMEENPEVLDDDLPDHFDDWIANLDLDLLLKYADKALIIARHEGVMDGLKRGEEIAMNVLTGKKQKGSE